MSAPVKGALRHLALALMIGMPIAAIPACGGNPIKGLCNDVCNCGSCSESELQECEENAEEAQQTADEEGCSAELDAYGDCLAAAFKCDDGDPVFTEDCRDEAEDLGDCGAVIPGVTDPCQRAAEICGGGTGEGEGEAECSGAAECLAQCIVDANACDPDTALECLGNCGV